MVCSKQVQMKCAAVVQETRKLHTKLLHVRELTNASNFMGRFFYGSVVIKNLVLFTSNKELFPKFPIENLINSSISS